MKKYPALMNPVPREIIWGGDLLKKKYGKTAPFAKIAESWELSCRDEAMCTVLGGEADGLTLRQYTEACGGDKGRFPLLIKFIDANDRLSVQVHPDDSEKDPETGAPLGKTEMWYVIDAAPGAKLVYGLSQSSSIADFAADCHDEKIEKHLNFVDVHPGDVYFIPAGQVHAIGAGILIAEIQQNSDTTYRVYDYCRVGADGKQRQLHTKKALNAIKIRTDSEIDSIRYSRGKEENCLANCDKFSVYRYTLNDTAVKVSAQRGFASVICTEGIGSISCDGAKQKISAGDTFYIPSGCNDTEITGNLTILTAYAN